MEKSNHDQHQAISDVSQLCYSLSKTKIQTEEQKNADIENILSCFHLNGCVILNSDCPKTETDINNLDSNVVQNIQENGELCSSDISRKLEVKSHLYNTMMDLVHHIDVIYALSEEGHEALKEKRAKKFGSSKDNGENEIEIVKMQGGKETNFTPLYKFDTLSYIPIIKEPFHLTLCNYSSLTEENDNISDNNKNNLSTEEMLVEGKERNIQLNVSPARYFGITRVARLGLGKKNIHFDPYDSKCHIAMAEFASYFGLTKLIQDYVGNDNVTVVETGMSYTRGGGEGLEWHADGEKGEVTVIMTMDNLQVDQGGLGILLGSHIKLQRNQRNDEEGEGKEQENHHEHANAHEENEEDEEDFDKQIANFATIHQDNHDVNKIYYYRAWHPILFDARLLHCAYKSTSFKRRVILWWIYNVEN